MGSIAMKGYSAFPKAPALLEPLLSYSLVPYPGHLLRGLTSLQRCSRCILQHQTTGLYPLVFVFINLLYTYIYIYIYICACVCVHNVAFYLLVFVFIIYTHTHIHTHIHIYRFGCLSFMAHQPLRVIQYQIRFTYMNYIWFVTIFYMNSLFLHKLTFLLNSCFDSFEPQVYI